MARLCGVGLRAIPSATRSYYASRRDVPFHRACREGQYREVPFLWQWLGGAGMAQTGTLARQSCHVLLLSSAERSLETSDGEPDQWSDQEHGTIRLLRNRSVARWCCSPMTLVTNVGAGEGWVAWEYLLDQFDLAATTRQPGHLMQMLSWSLT